MADATSWLALQGLTEADLEANRQGRITEAQIARIRKEAAGRKRLILLGMMFGAVGGSAAIATKASHARDLLLAVPVMFAAALLVGWLIWTLVNRRFEREIASGAVTAVEGTLDKLFLAPTRGGFVCTVRGTRYHAVQANALGRALTVGDPVRLFVLPRTGMIVAMERR